MTEEKWTDLINYIKERFEVLEHQKNDIIEGEGTLEAICFKGPMGKIKLEREIRPLVTGKKVISSKRPGSSVLEELEYSDTEKIDKLNAYRWDEEKEDWDVIDANQISNLNN